MDHEGISGRQSPSAGEVWEVVRLFLRLGLTAFGGPAAHIGLYHDEVVVRRKWIDDQHFLDLLGATNLIPGPNSTEMVIHLSYLRAGWIGLLAGGISFILPAMLMVLALAWAYVRYGTTPAAGWLLYGIKPVVIAIVLQALWGLGKKALKDYLSVGLGLVVVALYFVQVNELALLLGAGLLVMLVKNFSRLKEVRLKALLPPLGGLALPLAVAAGQPFSLLGMFLVFLKIGAVLYGSGYVLLAYLRADFVLRLGWLTDQQLIDAVAVGQVTPGPVFTAATFIGYLLGGLPGALLATLGIFLPSFLFVALSNPLIPRIRTSPWASGLLDGVNVASLGMMAAVTYQLGQAAFVDVFSLVLGAASALLLFRYKVNSIWLIAGGALLGTAFAVVRGLLGG